MGVSVKAGCVVVVVCAALAFERPRQPTQNHTMIGTAHDLTRTKHNTTTGRQR